MGYKNLSKTFKYINELGNEIIFEYDNGFLINKPVGIDTLSVSVSRASGINQIGDTVQKKKIEPRPITISGIFVGNSQQKNKEKLISVIRPDIKGKFYADDYFLDTVVTISPDTGNRTDFSKFNFSLLAPYPYWQSKNISKKVLSGLEYRFRLPINFTKPYKFAETIKTKFININNNSQVPVPFKVTFSTKSSCTNPKLINVSTGQFLQIKKTMVAGEKIVVDITHNKTYVLSSTDGDISGALTLNSNFFRLQIGENVVKPEAEIGRDELEVFIDFATEKVGIVI